MNETKVKSVKERYIDAYKVFFDKLYGVDEDYSKREEFKKYVEDVEKASKRFGEDIDVVITIKHRCGDFKLKNIDAYCKTKSMLEVIEKGVTLPEDVTSFEITAKLLVTKDGKRYYFRKKEDVIFDIRILLTNKAEDKKKVEKIVGKDIYKKDKNIRAFSKEDFNEFSKLIKIKEKEAELTV